MANYLDSICFYFDESGQDGSTQNVVVGGFGISKKYEENFTQDIHNLYKFCFGVPKEDNHELKGSGLLKLSRIANSKKYPPLKDAERQYHAGLVLSNSLQIKAHITSKDLAAFGQAGLLFL